MTLRSRLAGIMVAAYLWSAGASGQSLAPRPKIDQLTGAPVSLLGAAIVIEPGLEAAGLERLRAAIGTPTPGAPGIRIHRDSDLPPEGYRIDAGPGGAEVEAADPAGLRWGILRLAERLETGDGTLRSGVLEDWPDHRFRGVHLVVYGTRPEEIVALVENAAEARMNAVVLHLSSRWVELPPLSSTPPGGWSLETLKEVVDQIRALGFEVIPHLSLLTHQEHFLAPYRPDLLWDPHTYDPSQEETRKLTFEVLDRLVRLLAPTRLHIGHDELRGLAAPGARPFPPDLFVDEIRQLHAFLAARGVETWIWGDMFLPSWEFPEMAAQHLHGDRLPTALGALPAGLVVCDWHYVDRQPDFPSALHFTGRGFDVVGTTWKRGATIRNFSRYVSTLPRGGRGMLASTWYHVQRRDLETVREILRVSGSAFWNADRESCPALGP